MMDLKERALNAHYGVDFSAGKEPVGLKMGRIYSV
jgi:hypothetical protein